jgi:hypothetical protein
MLKGKLKEEKDRNKSIATRERTRGKTSLIYRCTRKTRKKPAYSTSIACRRLRVDRRT